MNKIEKNESVRNARRATMQKHRSQKCITFKFKIDQSSLSKEQKESIKMYFIEVKRLYNYVLSHCNDIFTADYRNYKNITYLDKDRNEHNYSISYIGSSVMQDTIRLMQESIKSLSASKKKGNTVGKLKFKSECNSIRLLQYGVTHKLKGSRFKIQGIKKPIKVSGLKQLRKYDNIDMTVANLVYDGYDYFITLTCFVDPQIKQHKHKDIIGVDFGCESTITLSNGEKYKVQVEESERLKGLQARLSTRVKRSNNWYKDLSLIRKEYNKMNNRKNDIANKIVHMLVSDYEIVVIQDDQLNEWHENKNLSSTIQHSVLGRLKSQLKKYDNVIVLDQWFPTTKHCFNCSTDVDLRLSDRTFICPNCGAKSDRDVHAANNMIEFYKQYLQSVGTPDLMPRKKILYGNYKQYLTRQEA